MEKDFQVKLLAVAGDSQMISAAGALGCFEEKSSAAIMEELVSLPLDQRAKKQKAVLKNSFGRGHGSVGDQNCFIFSIENLPRAATLQLCQPQYLAHLQQSLRRARASRGFHIPEIIKNSDFVKEVEKILYGSFELYEKMSQAGIPGEDARYILPLYTRTNIQTLGNARELSHLWKMTHSPHARMPSVVIAVVDEIFNQAKDIAPFLFEDFNFNYETLAWYPSVQLYAAANPTLQRLIADNSGEWLAKFSRSGFPDIEEGYLEQIIKQRNEAELANLKHIHFEFLAPMSLACFHQAIRQRTWDQSVESIYDALDAPAPERIFIPLSIRRSDLLSAFEEQHLQMWFLYKRMVTAGIPQEEAIGVIPHSVKIYDWIHINGWNALHAIGKRTCIEAQGEIRAIARQIARLIRKRMPALGKWSEPQCIIYGYCPEIRDCGYHKKKLKT